MKNRIITYSFDLFFILLLVSTYFGFAEYYIIIFFSFLVVFFYAQKNRFYIRTSSLYEPWFSWIVYYLLISLIGVCLNSIGFKEIIEFVIKYIVLPVCVYVCIWVNRININKLVRSFENFVLLSAIYGLIEYFFRYNWIVKILKITSVSWIEKMNGTSNYQGSSFFLHYNYYGCILVIGLVINLFIPYKNKIANTIYKVLIIEQIFIVQSRTAWISFALVICIYLIQNWKLTDRRLLTLTTIFSGALIAFLIKPEVFINIISMITNRFSLIVKYGLQNGSLGQRVGTLLNWRLYFAEHPLKGLFGTGYNSVNGYYLSNYSYFSGYSTVDCLYTVYLVDIGLIGSLLFILSIIRLLFDKTKNEYDKISKYVIIVLLVEALTLDVASNNFLLAVFYFGLIFIMMNRSDIRKVELCYENQYYNSF